MVSCLLTVLGACFTPNAHSDSMGSDSGENSTSRDTDAQSASSMSSTSVAPLDATSVDVTSSSTTTTVLPQTTSSSGTRPFCGDGVVDPEEECDDGVDNNALTAECLPDCNLNLCGDGNLSPIEECDDGTDNNVLEPGACAPDCSAHIETKRIVVSAFDSALESGDFGPNPAAAADAMCPSGYAALIAVPGDRQVTNTPNGADALVDWPLAPYTAYVNDDDVQVWITDDTPILAVRDGLPMDLDAPISSPDDFGGPYVVTGLRQDWTANTGENCGNFESDSPVADLALGTASSDAFFLEGDQFIDGCDDIIAQVYCVEQ